MDNSRKESTEPRVPVHVRRHLSRWLSVTLQVERAKVEVQGSVLVQIPSILITAWIAADRASTTISRSTAATQKSLIVVISSLPQRTATRLWQRRRLMGQSQMELGVWTGPTAVSRTAPYGWSTSRRHMCRHYDWNVCYIYNSYFCSYFSSSHICIYSSYGHTCGVGKTNFDAGSTAVSNPWLLAGRDKELQPAKIMSHLFVVAPRPLFPGPAWITGQWLSQSWRIERDSDTYSSHKSLESALLNSFLVPARICKKYPP